jgi:hypothetical protein
VATLLAASLEGREDALAHAPPILAPAIAEDRRNLHVAVPHQRDTRKATRIFRWLPRFRRTRATQPHACRSRAGHEFCGDAPSERIRRRAVMHRSWPSGTRWQSFADVSTFLRRFGCELRELGGVGERAPDDQVILTMQAGSDRVLSRLGATLHRRRIDAAR